VTRVRNADDFLLEYRNARQQYDTVFGPGVSKLRQKLVGSPHGAKARLNDLLEAHLRCYLVNALLGALNWRVGLKPEEGLPNLYLEAPVASVDTDRVQFLDYLGLERKTGHPALIIETKRPATPLPQLARPALAAHRHTPVILAEQEVAQALASGLAGERLRGQWTEWLRKLAEYVRSVHKAGAIPRRVVVTNGEWLIVFLDPGDAFLEEGTRNPAKIAVFLPDSRGKRSAVEKHYLDVFRYLEYHNVVGEIPSLEPGELPFHIGNLQVESVMHGLKLVYVEQPGVYQSRPVIKVAPVVVLRLRHWAWILVESRRNEYELPHDNGGKALAKHFDEVRDDAEALLRKVNEKLGTELTPLSLREHYEDDSAFQDLRGVTEFEPGRFLIVTGEETHYIRRRTSIRDCPYHDWAACNAQHVASDPGPIQLRSVKPRSFFRSGEPHHCAHSDVLAAKGSPVRPYNRHLCGCRSASDGQAFCEIWRFEMHLCCRACAFEEVCSAAAAFRLPCPACQPRKRGDVTQDQASPQART